MPHDFLSLPHISARVRRTAFSLVLTLLAWAGLLFCEMPQLQGAVEAGAVRAEVPAIHKTFLENHCIECHGPEKQKGKVRLDTLAFHIDSIETAEKWRKVLAQINSGEMPPDDYPKQPEKNAKADFLEALSNTMVIARKALTDQGGKITMRRLNRREYQNTLRAILGVDIEVSSLPADGSLETFDTVGSALFMSPDQFQLYRQLGRKALDVSFTQALNPREPRKFRAEAEAETVPAVERTLSEFVSIRKRHQQWANAVEEASRKPYNAAAAAEIRAATKDEPHKFSDAFYLQWEKIKDAPPPTEFGFPDAIDANMMKNRWDIYIPQGVDYLIKPKAKTGAFLGVAHLPHRWVTLRMPPDWPAGDYKARVCIAATEEGAPERRFVDFLAAHPNNHVISTHQVSGTMANPQIIEIPITIDKDGGRIFQFAEKGMMGNPDGKGTANQVFSKGYKQTQIGPEYALWVDWVEAEGPFPRAGAAGIHTTLREKLAELQKQPDDARPLLAHFAECSLRGRTLAPEVMERFVRLYELRRKAGDPPLEAIKEPLSVLLSSPSFLYLAEPAQENQPRTLTPLELATRLSFFIWSAPPDSELIQLAKQGELNKPEILSAQLERLLADPRSKEFTTSFVGQWLGMPRLDFFQVNERLHPAFDLPTKAAAKDEVFETFKLLLQQRGSLAKLLKSESVTVNGLLAAYYEIPGVMGDEFREVPLPSGSPRGGLLGMAAVLAMGGNGEQTSPVERGAWVLRKLLHDPPPPAPANVPQLNRLSNKQLTTPERITLHQEDPQCTQCHRKIDPIGFGLENFDAVGRWRTEDSRPGVPKASSAIKPAGTLHQGPSFNDYFELREIIASRPERFARGFTEALIEYALGRPFGFSDEELANQIVNRAAKKDFSIPEFLLALVDTKAFQSK